MGVTNKAFIELGSFVMGLNPDFAGSMVFGTGTSLFSNTTYYLDDEFGRKEINWSWNGTDPRGNVILGTTEQNGSYFGEIGLGSSDTLGSDLWTRDPTAVGSKFSTYSLEFQFDWRFRKF